eukprot:Protomagalhaensia_wolfi_Nauph_80__1840@NODE_2149_length_1197_cov_1665_608808_g1437_i1_p3_GENE_NODE_2149_length_1197_cov_1665_608808_g1437_i1NODE_2149_length_1197_cov_1665_608808_g1437_i1_p3_ORF_typecomplete_len104_score15_38DPM3/PF08285_11/5_3e10MFS_3/PF05977_13/0_0084Wzy_C/PF04932_15/0_02DUF4131/PF13567_6/0_2DUF2157/PF09925_9/0_23_NODE_2149_length_1197_cov_1665_608808_g1437_i1175486
MESTAPPELWTPSIPLPSKLLGLSRGKTFAVLVALYILGIVLFPFTKSALKATFAVLVFCGFYCLGIVMRQTQQFNRVPAAEVGLRKDIEKAKAMLKTRGFAT